jgi:hypothetical protein
MASAFWIWQEVKQGHDKVSDVLVLAGDISGTSARLAHFRIQCDRTDLHVTDFGNKFLQQPDGSSPWFTPWFN